MSVLSVTPMLSPTEARIQPQLSARQHCILTRSVCHYMYPRTILHTSYTPAPFTSQPIPDLRPEHPQPKTPRPDDRQPQHRLRHYRPHDEQRADEPEDDGVARPRAVRDTAGPRRLLGAEPEEADDGREEEGVLGYAWTRDQRELAKRKRGMRGKGGKWRGDVPMKGTRPPTLPASTYSDVSSPFSTSATLHNVSNNIHYQPDHPSKTHIGTPALHLSPVVHLASTPTAATTTRGAHDMARSRYAGSSFALSACRLASTAGK